MAREIKAFVLLIGSTFQAAMYLGIAFYCAPLFQEKWPLSFGWDKVLLISAFFGIVHLYYTLFVYLLAKDKTKK